MNVKQVIVARSDLKCSLGKWCAQFCHASIAFLKELYLKKLELSEEESEWMNGFERKIILSVKNEDQLLKLYEKAKDLGLKSFLIEDAGLTEFNNVPTKTCIAIGPHEDEKLETLTKRLRLFKMD